MRLQADPCQEEYITCQARFFFATCNKSYRPEDLELRHVNHAVRQSLEVQVGGFQVFAAAVSSNFEFPRNLSFDGAIGAGFTSKSPPHGGRPSMNTLRNEDKLLSFVRSET